MSDDMRNMTRDELAALEAALGYPSRNAYVSPTIPPALTAEEWAEKREGPWDEHRTRGERDVFFAVLETQLDRHALAALCLHEQPYGFTREDIATILDLQGAALKAPAFCPATLAVPSLLERIAALLPPEG